MPDTLVTRPVPDALAELRLLPVIALPDAALADPLADALVAGGLPCAEVTFRTAAAEASIKAMAARGDLLVGAGTVLTTDQAERAVQAGARFVVAPGTDPKVVTWCVEQGVPVFPGVATPTDIAIALSLGLDTVKFFPAEPLGGVPMLKALAAPYGGARFVPTGGIGPGIVGDYLALPQVVACGGSWMVKKEWLADGDFDRVRDTAAEAVKAVASAG